MTVFSEGDERRLVYLLQTNEDLTMLAHVLAEAVPGRRDDAHLATHREFMPVVQASLVGNDLLPILIDAIVILTSRSNLRERRIFRAHAISFDNIFSNPGAQSEHKSTMQVMI